MSDPNPSSKYSSQASQPGNQSGRKPADPSRYINRELSWLEFNQRVLDQALDPSIADLERLKFLAITASNLDEFFMVRVGGLQRLTKRGSTRTDPSGMTPEEQLSAVTDRTREMTTQQYANLNDDLLPKLREAGVFLLSLDELTEEQGDYLDQVLREEIESSLTPQAIEPETDFPLLANQTLNLCVRLAPRPDGTPDEPPTFRFAIIPFGSTDTRFVTLSSDQQRFECIAYEDVVRLTLSGFFQGEEILEAVPFRITRNADLEMQEDQAADLLIEMEGILDARRESDCVRLEVDAGVSEETKTFLQSRLEIGETETYLCPGPLALSDFMRLSGLKGFESLRDKDWPPVPSAHIDPTVSVFETLTEKSILLYHPYHSFEPVLRMIDEAADDPDVLAIKQTLYRTSRNSPIVAALMRAAANGKHVTALVEIKARFDEQRNIGWAKTMEQNGVQVIYGVKGLKTHAKICLIVRRSTAGIQKFVHYGTGNYNEQTARLYGDISYLTANEDLTADASGFFNAICGYSQPLAFREIETAPFSLRERVLELIEGEVERHRQGQPAFIRAKVNSLVDPKLIDALSRAADEGVRVELNIRGICCLRPNSPNIRVTSIIDHYLEHARIIHVHRGGDDAVLISSADWMPRNLDRRVELLVPIDDRKCRDRLIRYLSLHFDDNVKASQLESDGSYRKLTPGDDPPFRSQEALYDLISQRSEQSRNAQPIMFEPHRPG